MRFNREVGEKIRKCWMVVELSIAKLTAAYCFKKKYALMA